jgi:transglutaminase-like putative cysteine protease
MIAAKGVRSARAVLAAAGLLAAGAATAADYRLGPMPAWVRPVPFDSAAHPQADAANVAYGARYDLIDDQVRLSANARSRFHHVVSEAITDKGIDDLSHREIEVDPQWETLVISQLDVIRDGRRVSRLHDMRVKVLQRERDLDSRIYDGRKMVALDLPDIRVGDIVEFAYTRSGMNPVFQGHHAGDFDMQWQVPVTHVHRRLSSAVDLPLRVAQLTGAAPPQRAQADGFDERVWDAHDVPGLRIEASVPGTFNPYPWIEWSDFASWGEVARWAERLYQAPARLSPALQAAIDGIAQQSPEADARVVAVLRLVQQQVRYLGVEIGAGTHAPSPPDAVYARRWGDCKEKALLMVTMLRALGIDASPALVNTERRADVDHDLPNAGSFDHAITRVRLAGVDYWLDPTRSPQQGTLATVSQSDYARALVLDGRSAALTAMRANTPSAHSREVRIDVDSRAGFDQPVKFDVRTTYRGFSADMMRDELGNGDRADLQHRYLNFYAASYAGIQVAAPFDVSDDTRANTVVVTEHYAVKDFWPAAAQGARQAAVHVPEIDNELRAPAEPIRTMPLSLHGPQSLREQVRVQLPQAWPDAKFDRTIANEAFRLSKSLRIQDRVLTADYALEIGKDQVDAAAVAGLTRDIGKAQDLLGDRLSTERAGGQAWTRGAGLACVVAAVLVALGWQVFRRRRRFEALPGADSAAASVAGPETAANDSEQPLAA